MESKISNADYLRLVRDLIFYAKHKPDFILVDNWRFEELRTDREFNVVAQKADPDKLTLFGVKTICGLYVEKDKPVLLYER